MNYEKLISDVNLAFAGNQFEVSLKKAQEAINKDDSKAEGYVCAGKAALSLGSAEMAEHYFKTATEKDKNNGNIFFLLGYAQASPFRNANPTSPAPFKSPLVVWIKPSGT